MSELSDLLQDAKEYALDMQYARALPAMMDAAKEEVDRHKRDGTDLFWEALSYDAWCKPRNNLYEIRQYCYHGDALELGKLMLANMDQYLFAHCYAEISDDWEKYVNE